MALPAVCHVLKCVPFGRFPFVAEVPMGRLAACVCGRLRVSCNREPVKISLCHCLECQRRTGSPYGIAAFFRRADVEPNGQDQRFTRQSDGGYPVTFHFCPGCGSSVYWEPSRIPEMIAVAVGALLTPHSRHHRNRFTANIAIRGSTLQPRRNLIHQHEVPTGELRQRDHAGRTQLNASANENVAPSRDWEYRDGASQDPAADEAYRRMQSAIAIRAT